MLLLVVGLPLSLTAQNIHWPDFMAANDLVWTNLQGVDFYKGAFIGDGLQGAMIMQDTEDTNAVRMLISHYNAITHNAISGFEYCQSRVFAGDIIIAPKAQVQSQTMRLNLWNGEATGEILTARGRIEWKAFCERTHNVFIVTVATTDGEAESTPIVREEWGITPRLYLDKKKPEDLANQLPPKPVQSRLEKLALVTQKMKTQGAHVVASQLIEKSKSQKILFVAIGTDDNADPDKASPRAAKDAAARVRAAVREGYTALIEKHHDWWHRYLQNSYLELPDDPYWQKFWWLQIYKFGSASAENSSCLIDTQGPWIWNTAWAAIWWNLNVQLSYFPMYSANQLAAGRSLIQGVDRLYRSGAFRQNAKPNPGITVGRISTQNGRGSWGTENGNLSWVLHGYWKYWRYSGDDAIGRALYPMLQDNAAFLISQLTADASGVLHMKPSRSPEYDDKLHPDVNYGLMSARWVLQTLLSMNAELNLRDPRKALWQDTLDHLTAFPVDKNGFRISSDQGFDTTHRHYSHLLAIYPYHLVYPEMNPAMRDLIQHSVDHWQGLKGGHAGYTYTGGCAMYATLGEADQALETLDCLKPMVRKNTMYYESGGQVVETPLSAVESLDYLLLQSWGGVIRIFPAVPSRWQNLAFKNFRTEGAFLVSASWKNGAPESVTLRSEAGKQCQILSPWKNQSIEVRDDSGNIVATTHSDGTFSFPTEKGKSYRLGKIAFKR